VQDSSPAAAAAVMALALGGYWGTRAEDPELRPRRPFAGEW
jgi:hypothetical protein